MQKRICILMTIMLAVAAVSTAALAQQDIRIQVNGELVEMDAKPFIENDRVLVPLRGVFEKLGAVVEWFEEEQAVVISGGCLTVRLIIGRDSAELLKADDAGPVTETVRLDVPARIKEGRTFIPVRFVAEALGADVSWDDAHRTVIIETGEQSLAYERVTPQDIQDSQDLFSWYQANHKTRGVHFKNHDGAVYILAAAGEKPTGGYGIDVEGVYLEGPGKVVVETDVTSPDPGMMVTQVITYPSVLIRVDGLEVLEARGVIIEKGDMITGQIGESLGEMGKAIPADKMLEMVMYSITGEEVNAFSREEALDIIITLNASPTYNGPYLMMLAGNNIKIVFEGGTEISLTSYGNKEHVLVNGEVDGVNYSYCVVCPEVGALLLDTGAK
ncbi:MAG: protease complex subunit PrcB family protein [Clostridiales bacterium]|nr:protease complex subunit PrcB family protein [Clostridiales bacterium]